METILKAKYKPPVHVKRNISKIFKYAILILIGMFFLMPFFVLITRSLMSDKEVITIPVRFFPSVPQFSNYLRVLDAELLKYSLNTVYVIGFNIIAVPLGASICAFGFAKMKFKGKDGIFAICMATVMLPGIVIQIPSYVLFKNLGWLNTLLPLTIPSIFGGGVMNIFLIRQFMRSTPRAIDDAARIDGAGVLTLFFKIVVPMCFPVIMLVMVNTFIGNWNDFMGPLVYVRDERWYTINVGIYNKYLGGSGSENQANLQMAVGVIMMLPPAVVFMVFQKQLIEGVVLTGMKG